MTTDLGPDFDIALRFASDTHRGQKRKGSEVPYVSHLLAVCALVLENGGTEAEAIAALLHDAPEDCGGQPMLDEIRRRFGDEVAEIVEGCTDTLEDPKPAWRPRKQAYIEHLREAPRSVLLVANADKLHNARAVLADYEVVREDLWERFNGGREGTLWYYRALDEVFREHAPGPLANELHRVVEQLPPSRS